MVNATTATELPPITLNKPRLLQAANSTTVATTGGTAAAVAAPGMYHLLTDID